MMRMCYSMRYHSMLATHAPAFAQGFGPLQFFLQYPRQSRSGACVANFGILNKPDLEDGGMEGRVWSEAWLNIKMLLLLTVSLGSHLHSMLARCLLVAFTKEL